MQAHGCLPLASKALEQSGGQPATCAPPPSCPPSKTCLVLNFHTEQHRRLHVLERHMERIALCSSGGTGNAAWRGRVSGCRQILSAKKRGCGRRACTAELCQHR